MDQNPLADIVGTPISRQRNSRLSFEELCGFYAAFAWDVELGVIVRASGLDRSTAAHLRNAGQFRSGQTRYPRVAAEFARLGKADFSTKYLTAPLKDRLRVAKLEHDRAAAEPRSNRINFNADAYAGVHAFPNSHFGPDTKVEIVPDRGVRPGWTWRDLSPNRETDELRGDPRTEESRFAKSKAALDFCRLRFMPKDADFVGEMGFSPAERACDDSWFWSQKKLQK
jgi:hypothetical protein